MTRRTGTLASLAALASLVLAPAVPTLAVPAAAAPADVAPPVATPAAPGDPGAPDVTTSSVVDAIFVADALVAAGTDPAEAIAQVAALTTEDLAVLAGHPAMVQVAGNNAALTRNLVLGLVVLGAIIALAAASDGGGAVVTN